MTNIRPPGTPTATEAPPKTATQTQAPQTTQEQQAPDTLGTVAQGPQQEAPAQVPPSLHLPIPPNLRPIRTPFQPPTSEHITHDSPTLWASPFAHLVDTPTPTGQAEAVAQGALGLTDTSANQLPPPTGIWASPANLFDSRGLSAGGQQTMAKLEEIDQHINALASLLKIDID